MGIGPTEWLLLAFLVVLLFGSGKISALMGDVAKGIKAFRRGMTDDSDAASGLKP
jgi:sec-independent protein translocase protein TatA